MSIQAHKVPDWMEHKIDARNWPFITANMQLEVGLKSAVQELPLEGQVDKIFGAIRFGPMAVWPLANT